MEPATVLKAGLVGVALYGIFPTFDSSLFIASVCGAAISILYTENKSIKKNVVAFAISITCGIILARFTADLINHFLPEKVQLNEDGGALIASAVTVGAVGFLIKATKNPIETLSEIKKDDSKDDKNE